jgi:hypothetical protein
VYIPAITTTRVFRYYCATGGGNDVNSMNQNAWSEFVQDIKVLVGSRQEKRRYGRWIYNSLI